MTQFFNKSKKPYFGGILGARLPKLGKNEFS